MKIIIFLSPEGHFTYLSARIQLSVLAFSSSRRLKIVARYLFQYQVKWVIIPTLLELFGRVLLSFTRSVTDQYSPEEPDQYNTEYFGYNSLESTGRE